MSVLPSPETKADYIKESFANIAAGYDRTNRVMTFGLDQGWRTTATWQIAPPTQGRALDVGTGTGDFLPLLATWMPDGLAVGVDFCLPMMQEGQPKIEQIAQTQRTERFVPGAMAFVTGDALELPFPDNSFDAITTGFVLRNVTDIEQALREMWRVARPGGMLACLDVARPRNPLVGLGHRLYFEQIVPWIGALLQGERRFYTYLPQSARAFPPPDELAALMQAAGWQFVSYKLHGIGAVAIHIGAKI